MTGWVFQFLSSGLEFLAPKGTGTVFQGVSLLPNFRFITGRFSFFEPFEAFLISLIVMEIIIGRFLWIFRPIVTTDSVLS